MMDVLVSCFFFIDVERGEGADKVSYTQFALTDLTGRMAGWLDGYQIR